MFSGARDKDTAGCHWFKLIFSCNVFYYTYESCIIMGEVRAILDCGAVM